MPERGELVLVPFPFSDLSATKRRPVLVLTRSDAYGDFIALPVTSQPHHSEVVPIMADDLLDGALPVASWARTDRVVTLNASLVVKTIARVQEETVRSAISRLFRYIEKG